MKIFASALRGFVAALSIALVTAAGAANVAIKPQTGSITTQNLNATGDCTPGSCVVLDISTAGSAQIGTLGTYTASGGLSAQLTLDYTNWITLGDSLTFTRVSNKGTSATIASGQTDNYQVAGLITGARGLRIVALGAVTGSAAVTISAAEPAIGGGGGSGGGGGGAITAASGSFASGALSSGSMVDLGSQADSPCGTDTGTCTAIALTKRANQNLTTLAGTNTDLTAVQTPIAPATATATKGNLVGAQYNSSPPTFTNGQQGGLQITSAGALITSATFGAGSAVIGKVGIDQATPGTTNLVQSPDGAQVSGTISAAIPTASVTITNASPAVFTWTSHGRSVNDAIVLTTSGTLPAPLVAGNTVYVLTVVDANTFTVALTPGGAAINTSSAGSGTHTANVSVLFQTTMDGYGGLSFAYGPTSSANFAFEQSEDQTYWFGTMVQDNSSTSSTLSLITTTAGATNTSKYWPKKARYFRIRCTTYTSGTTTVTGTKLAGSPGGIAAIYSGNLIAVGPTGDSGTATYAPLQIAGQTKTSNRAALATDKVVSLFTDVVGKLIVRPNSIPEAEWTYPAATGGISNTTTAVTMVGAAGAGIRNYVTSCQVSSDALGAATELAIRDDAGGTVLWRLKVGTAGILSYHIGFGTPLKGTANKLLEVVTLTASVTGGVFINCQGYTAP